MNWSPEQSRSFSANTVDRCLLKAKNHNCCCLIHNWYLRSQWLAEQRTKFEPSLAIDNCCSKIIEASRGIFWVISPAVSRNAFLAAIDRETSAESVGNQDPAETKIQTITMLHMYRAKPIALFCIFAVFIHLSLLGRKLEHSNLMLRWSLQQFRSFKNETNHWD